MTSAEALLDAVAAIDEQGFAVADEELEQGLRSAAAPVRGSRAQVVAALNVSTATARVDRAALLRDLVPPLCRTAADVSARLGYREPSVHWPACRSGSSIAARVTHVGVLWRSFALDSHPKV